MVSEKTPSTLATEVNITIIWSPSESNIYVRKLCITNESTIAQALEIAFDNKCDLPQDWRTAKVGIYGKLKPRDTVLREHDRLEIYRALVADPKEARRLRAKAKPLPKHHERVITYKKSG